MVDVSDKTQVSAQVLADAKKKLNEMTATWTSGVCWGTCLDLEGKEMITPHRTCHSWVGSAYATVRDNSKSVFPYPWNTTYIKDAKQFLVLSCHSKKRSQNICSAEAMDAIILWMARESPFSEFVLNRDDDDSLLNGGVILLCGPGALTQAQSMWICKVLRYSTEGAKALDTWLELYKGGVNPLLAVLVCSYVRTIKGATFGFTGIHDHSTVFRTYSKEPDVASLLKGKINPNAVDTSSVFGGNDGRLKKRNGVPASVIIKGFCKPMQKDDGWGGKIDTVVADGPEFVRRVLEWQHDVEGTTAPPAMPSKNTVFLDLDL